MFKSLQKLWWWLSRRKPAPLPGPGTPGSAIDALMRSREGDLSRVRRPLTDHVHRPLDHSGTTIEPGTSRADPRLNKPRAMANGSRPSGSSSSLSSRHDDALSSPLHPLNPINSAPPILIFHSEPERSPEPCSAPSRSDSGSASYGDSSPSYSCSSSSDSSSSSSDSSSSSSSSWD